MIDDARIAEGHLGRPSLRGNDQKGEVVLDLPLPP
jgi:hypothetical protein